MTSSPRGEDERKQADGRPRRSVPDIVRKLEARRERYEHRSIPFRVAWTTVGFLLLATGIAMTVFPGPAIVVIPAGLAMLSFEFAWAERLLDFALTRGMDAKEYAEQLDRTQKRAALLGAGCLLAALIGAIVVYAV